MLIQADTSSTIETTAENCSYVMVSAAIHSLLRNFDSETAIEAYSDFKERRQRADEILFDLVGQHPQLFYIRRIGTGQEPGEEIWSLTVATDRDNEQFPVELEARGKTLGFKAAVPSDGSVLRLLSCRLLPKAAGQSDGYTARYCLRLLPHYRHRIGIPSAIQTRMATMPICGEHVPTQDQLKAWEAFLKIEEKIAQARQFCVSFVAHNYGAATRQITFEIDVTSATLDGSSEALLDIDDFWKRVKQARHEDLKLFENAPTENNRNNCQLGTIEEVDPDSSTIRVKLEREFAEYLIAGEYQLPTTGYLVFQARGEIAQIKRKKKALEALHKGHTQNPYLGNFLFDARLARPCDTLIQLQPQDLLLPSANLNQQRAVETVLSAPDLVLIQGPPGTGKTTVIAEICYQVARQGGRTLITSQANLAVDNALSRLIHNPAIRAVRKGNRNSVGEEGLPFLEDRVIGTWLQNTANDCEKNLKMQLDNVEVFRRLLASSTRFTAYSKAEEALIQQQHRQAHLESICSSQATAHAAAAAELRLSTSLKSELDNLVAAMPSVNWRDPAIVDLLAHLQPYASQDSSLRSFTASVQAAVNLATEVSLTPPACGIFGLAAWLQDTVGVWARETQTAIAYADDVVTAMTNAESAAQIYTQNSACLVRLQQDCQNMLANEQTLQQKLQQLQNRQSQINFAAREFAAWLSSAYSNIFSILAKCLRQRQNFTANSIVLPAALLTLANEEDFRPWQQNLNQYQTQFNRFVQQYRQWDKVTTLASELQELILQAPKVLEHAPSQAAIDSATNALHKIDDRNPATVLEKLILSARSSLNEIQTPLGFWGRLLEWLLVKASQIQQLEPIVKRLYQYNRHFKATIKLQAIAKLHAIQRQAQIIIQETEPSEFQPVLDSLTSEIVDSINTIFRTGLDQLQQQTKLEFQQIKETLTDLQQSIHDRQQKIAITQEQLATSQREADVQFRLMAAIAKEFTLLPNLPLQLQALAQQCLLNSTDILAHKSYFSSRVQFLRSHIEKLTSLISSLDLNTVLSTLKNIVDIENFHHQKHTNNTLYRLTESQAQLQTVETQLQQQLEQIEQERSWWQSAYEAIPERLKPIPTTHLFSPEFLHQVKTQFDTWQQELTQEEAYLRRYQHFVSDWISKLRNPSAQDQNELRQIYLNNANVIGITCVQAASREFSEEFQNFDVVIIDEVSKCTPPELLIPALKGKKLV
ncbi:AAA domain-containing protein [Chroococcidiopsis sp. TS-821]|uniref:AAA domain-containing protein n=1 Tax=Chroococcidiopsis sp. TS-821 TaxID=1378066 RepID=UPI000CEE4989|nr:AAA domain-containing protein [Chroococcidiopsis sp. TS-821]PPS40718.1 hypothetical protein B1A85_19800 [Chroococcidiopsis sp. TS-821]